MASAVNLFSIAKHRTCGHVNDGGGEVGFNP